MSQKHSLKCVKTCLHHSDQHEVFPLITIIMPNVKRNVMF